MSIFSESLSSSRAHQWRRRVLSLSLVLGSIFGWLRMVEAFKGYDYLIQLGLNPHPLYFVISGGLIGMLFLFAFITLIKKTTWSTIFIQFCGIFLGILFAVENVFLSKHGMDLFSMLIGLIFILIIYWLPEKRMKSQNIK